MRKKYLLSALPFVVSIMLVAALALVRGHMSFDESLFSIDRVMETTARLSQPNMEGRGLDGKGHELTALYLEDYFKKEGLTYKTLPSKMLVPIWNPSSRIQLASGETYDIYNDFRPNADYYGTSLDYQGELLYLGTDYYEVKPSLLKGKILCVKTKYLTQDQIEYIRDTGAKGVLYLTAGDVSSGFVPTEKLDQKTYDLSNKLGSDFFQAEISPHFAEALRVKALEQPLSGYENTKAVV